jgi:hypothetical protein
LDISFLYETQSNVAIPQDINNDLIDRRKNWTVFGGNFFEPSGQTADRADVDAGDGAALDRRRPNDDEARLPTRLRLPRKKTIHDGR